MQKILNFIVSVLFVGILTAIFTTLVLMALGIKEKINKDADEENKRQFFSEGRK